MSVSINSGSKRPLMSDASSRSMTSKKSGSDASGKPNGRRTAITAENMLGDTKVVKEEELELYSMEDIRLRIKKFMTHSMFGRYYENILLFFSVASALEYIYQTYLSESTLNKVQLMFWLEFFEKVLAVVFMADWTLNFFLADHKILFVTRCVSVCV